MHALRSALRAPEGKWAVTCERPPKINFAPDAVVLLSLASLPPDGDEGSTAVEEYVLLNTQQLLYICRPTELNRVRAGVPCQRSLPHCSACGSAAAAAAALTLLACCRCTARLQEPLRVIDFRHLGPSAGGPAYPTCHVHTPSARDEFDLAVGLSTGEGERWLWLGCCLAWMPLGDARFCCR